MKQYIFIIFLISIFSCCKNQDKKVLTFNEEIETNQIIETVIDSIVAGRDNNMPDDKFKVKFVFINDTLKKGYEKTMIGLCKIKTKNQLDNSGSLFFKSFTNSDTVGISADKKINIDKIFKNKKYKIYSTKNYKDRVNIYHDSYVAVNNISRIIFSNDKNKSCIYISYSCGLMCGASICFFLDKKDNKWEIKYAELKSIS